MEESTDRISYAVDKCLKYTIVFDSSAVAAIDFIAMLKLNPILSEGEIAEVTSRVIDELGERAHKARSENCCG
jgi:hypothetical protein